MALTDETVRRYLDLLTGSYMVRNGLAHCEGRGTFDPA